ncbi:uracil-DNA glycosylase [Pseudobacteroides cellulosolvens]|uniref:Uracil-DNA glycosylase superfamily n=1 Tax=Pseudobacteroides cellulosolvens ATCC 35603 = DSM 2933 TaxID=398512 RepID=A0A0L6JNC0_9FIRM|nr:uracil-DNA glycosylase [Pseudobacteroides cellulosolvens]KNY27269.1 Uracil-DNA glycosylase superfamily [Pseudobacteroides cellulosolvens ATCC 35603 = DSM 2933]
MSKQDRLNKLFEEYQNEFAGEEIVLDCGNIDTRILLIGEAPGKDEVKLSQPFVGAAGKNLNKFLEVIGLMRDNIFVANSIKYRLSKINPKSGRKINRPPTKDEIEKNQGYLLKEIGIISPEIIVTLGNVPLKMVSGDKSISIGNVHGEIMKIQVLDKEYSLYPLYHPASIIYNAGLQDVYMEDVVKLKGILEK